MSHNCLANANLSYHQDLLAIDVDSAVQTKNIGCRHCSCTLHQSNYPRITFGLNAEIAPLYDTRFSFSCSVCRRRTMPPSVRFLGRRRYAATIFILLCASRSFTPTKRCCERLAHKLGIYLSLITIKRWKIWWSKCFPKTRFWLAAKARFSANICGSPTPKTLLQSFVGASLSQQLSAMLLFLSPLTTHVN